eukprot:IDg22863t1
MSARTFHSSSIPVELPSKLACSILAALSMLLLYSSSTFSLFPLTVLPFDGEESKAGN